MLYSVSMFVFAIKTRKEKRSTGLERVIYCRFFLDYFGSDRYVLSIGSDQIRISNVNHAIIGL